MQYENESNVLQTGSSMKQFFKKIYQLIPFKRYFFSVLKRLYIPKHSVYQHLHFVGVFRAKVDKDRSFKMKHYGFQVENDIFWTGITDGWEKNSLKLWTELCRSSDVIFDIGANTGVYGLLAKTLRSDARVFALEPVKRVFEKLAFNNTLNNYDIECIEKAASNFDGTATIFDTSSAHTYSVTVNQDTTEKNTEAIPVEISTVQVDTLIEQYQLSKIDLLKIDVETHEVEVLEGFHSHLKDYLPTMLIEILNDKVAKGIEDIIKDMGYLYFNIDEINGVRQVQHLAKSEHYNFLICQPDIAATLKGLEGAYMP